jgi:hypothetical protein
LEQTVLHPIDIDVLIIMKPEANYRILLEQTTEYLTLETYSSKIKKSRNISSHLNKPKKIPPIRLRLKSSDNKLKLRTCVERVSDCQYSVFDRQG